jgi:hypothetical protein
VGGRGRNKGKKTKNFSSPVARLGEEEEETVLPKNIIVSFSFFFSEECMKWRSFSYNAPFHLNGNCRQSVSYFKSVLQFA